MDTINNIELRDEHVYPDDQVLRSVLGPSFTVYKSLLNLFDIHDMSYEWRYYHDGKAWLCKVQQKKRTIVWMSAWKNFMQATIYFPLRLINNVLELDISEVQKEKILNTKNVGKSKPCIFEVREASILEDFEKVMLLKIKTK